MPYHEIFACTEWAVNTLSSATEATPDTALKSAEAILVFALRLLASTMKDANLTPVAAAPAADADEEKVSLQWTQSFGFCCVDRWLELHVL